MDTKTEVVECMVCYDEGNRDDMFTCGDSNCFSFVCEECISSYIECSEEDGKLPKCCNIPNCKSYYLYSDIKRISKEITKLYESCFLKRMTTTKGTEFQKNAEQLKIIAKIREKRMKFIKASFPPAVAKLAEFSFKNKLRRIERFRLNLIKNKMKLARRFCMNISCDGFLNEDLTCLTCLTQFCKHCEKQLDEGHVCKQEDIDSVDVIRSCVKCPTCNLPVVKEIGCDQMTCSNCNTHFIYTTGKFGGLGNHGQNESINVITEKKKLSKLFNLEKFPMLNNLLNELDSSKPKIVDSKYWEKPLKRYYKDKNKKIAGKNIAQNFDKYTRYLYNSRDYQKRLKEVEKIVKEYFSDKPVPENMMTFTQKNDYGDTLDKIKVLL